MTLPVVDALDDVTPPARLTDPREVFATKGDNWNGALPLWNTQLLAFGQAVVDEGTALVESAETAADASVLAAGESGDAKDDAEAAATAAAASAVTASAAAASAVSSPGATATSTTNLTLAEGAQVYYIEAGKTIWPGQHLVVAYAADPTKWMVGPVTSYDNGTGEVHQTIERVQGAGTHASWKVSLAAPGASDDIARSERAANTILGQGDKGAYIEVTGTFTQTFSAAATLGDGWYCWYKNAGTGVITLDPNGAETVDGVASYVMYPGEARLFQCNGVNLKSILLTGGRLTSRVSGDFIPPPGYASAILRLTAGGQGGSGGAGGGSGRGINTSSGSGGSGGGGGGGGRNGSTAERNIAMSAFTVGVAVPYVIGAGGTGGNGGNGGAGAASGGAGNDGVNGTTGSTGGTSTLGAAGDLFYMTVTGGDGGLGAATKGLAGLNSQAGGTGGSVTGSAVSGGYSQAGVNTTGRGNGTAGSNGTNQTSAAPGTAGGLGGSAAVGWTQTSTPTGGAGGPTQAALGVVGNAGTPGTTPATAGSGGPGGGGGGGSAGVGAGANAATGAGGAGGAGAIGASGELEVILVL